MQSADSEESKSDQSMSHRRESRASSLSPPFGKDSVRLLQNLHLDKSDPQELQPSLRCHRCEGYLLDRISSFGSLPCKIPLERNFLWTWSFLNLIFLLLIWWNITILMIFSTLPKLPGPHGEEHEPSQSVQEPLPPSTSRWILRLSGAKQKVRVHSIMTAWQSFSETDPTSVIGSRMRSQSWWRQSWILRLRQRVELMPLDAGELGNRSD